MHLDLPGCSACYCTYTNYLCDL